MHSDGRPDFFRALLDRESNIDSGHMDWYADNLDRPVIDYWAVQGPGRLRRSVDTGAPVRERVTVSEFLRRTGVWDLFLDRETIGISAVQSAVVNPWGFVGYQFGEQLLTDLHYYRPAAVPAVVDGRRVEVDSCYSSTLPESTWAHGRTSCVHRDPASGALRVATDVNTWQGVFTGKHGVWSFEDLRRHDSQVSVLRESLRHSLDVLGRLLGDRIQQSWDVRAPGPSVASLLAASHLCGPFAVAEHLATGEQRADEAGTSITAYLKEFAHVPLSRSEVYREES